jgi:hypothetical protein
MFVSSRRGRVGRWADTHLSSRPDGNIATGLPDTHWWGCQTPIRARPDGTTSGRDAGDPPIRRIMGVWNSWVSGTPFVLDPLPNLGVPSGDTPGDRFETTGKHGSQASPA